MKKLLLYILAIGCLIAITALAFAQYGGIRVAPTPKFYTYRGTAEVPTESGSIRLTTAGDTRVTTDGDTRVTP